MISDGGGGYQLKRKKAIDNILLNVSEICMYYKGPLVELNVNVFKLNRFAKLELTSL